MMCGFLSSGDGDGLVFLLSFFALLSYLLFSHHHYYLSSTNLQSLLLCM